MSKRSTQLAQNWERPPSRTRSTPPSARQHPSANGALPLLLTPWPPHRRKIAPKHGGEIPRRHQCHQTTTAAHDPARRRTAHRAGEIARAQITDLEVGYSARNEGEWDELQQAISEFDLVESTAAQHRRALQVQRSLAQRSQRGRKIPDLLVAAAAEEHRLTVLHYDCDFDIIAAVTGQACQWVVPAGSVD